MINLTQLNSQSEADCDSDGLVNKTKTAGGEEQGMKPVNIINWTPLNKTETESAWYT
jgi:hypothetical protein